MDQQVNEIHTDDRGGCDWYLADVWVGNVGGVLYRERGRRVGLVGDEEPVYVAFEMPLGLAARVPNVRFTTLDNDQGLGIRFSRLNAHDEVLLARE